jgi:hypothetical protein
MEIRQMVEALREAADELEPVSDGRYEATLASAGLHRSRKSGKIRLMMRFRVNNKTESVTAFLPTEGKYLDLTARAIGRFLILIAEPGQQFDWGRVISQLMEHERRCMIEVRTRLGFQNVSIGNVLI